MRRAAALTLVVLVFAVLLSSFALDASAQIVRPIATPRGASTLRPAATARYPEGITLDTIPGLVARWSADTLVLSNNDPVVNWVDASSGTKTFTQPTANNRPTYKTAIFASGKPAVSCDNDVAGQNDFLRIDEALSVASAGALYAVLVPRDSDAGDVWFAASVDSTNTLRTPVNHNSGDGQWKQSVRSAIANLAAIGYTTNSGALAVNTAVVIRVGSSGTAWSIRVNATEMAMTGSGSRGGNNGEWFDDQVFTSCALCALSVGGSGTLQSDVDIGEFIIVDGSQWTVDDDAVFTLLNTKYTVY